jgi:nickel/cobalt transporter (NicO) family protein
MSRVFSGLLLLILLICAVPVLAHTDGAEPLGLLQQVREFSADAQRILHTQISGEVQRIKAGEGFPAVMALLMVGFLYGVFHALAPGHGKVIVASYFLSRTAPLWQGIAAGAAMAAGHTASAVLIVVGLRLALDLSPMSVLAQAKIAEQIGYGLITLIGLWILVNTLRGKGHQCCGCGHDHHHEHGHTHSPSPAPASLSVSRPQMIGLFGSAAMVPCTGAIILLLFTLANGLLGIGVLATLMIALGMGLTITAIGFTAILLRRSVLSRLENSKVTDQIGKAAALLGASVITAFGALLFLGTLTP